METIEQLKNENEKLKERLANAIKIFNEQKTTIDLLNKEMNMLTEENKKLNKSIDSLMQKNIKYKASHKSPTMKRMGDNMIAGENVGI